MVQNGPICVFVRYDSTFFRIGSLVFFIFCMKLSDHKYSKLMELNFLGRFSPAQKHTKGSKMVELVHLTVYSVFRRFGLLMFFYILHEVEGS